ncbi:hypothetical protein MTR_0029s0230 [Medicago truncatula]|uniref:Uncharacterized protein n=1 Tax=Medicago truncatula TaxID=3880 RepID=A0A072TK42_MEDTR|nr:hypothetical protein MTR_0029s0230 [Medicago truncatula]
MYSLPTLSSLYPKLRKRKVKRLPRLTQTSNKKVRPREFQEGDSVPKKVLPFQPDSRSKWTPNYEGSCAMTFSNFGW